MKKSLSDEIVENYFDFLHETLSSNFLIDKKISIELDTGEKIENQMWAANAKVSNKEINILTTNFNVDSNEWISAFKFENDNVYIVKLSEKEKNIFSIYENKWVPLSSLAKAKFLAGIEFLKINIFSFEKEKNYMNLYKHIVGFANYAEGNQSSNK